MQHALIYAANNLVSPCIAAQLAARLWCVPGRRRRRRRVRVGQRSGRRAVGARVVARRGGVGALSEDSDEHVAVVHLYLTPLVCGDEQRRHGVGGNLRGGGGGLRRGAASPGGPGLVDSCSAPCTSSLSNRSKRREAVKKETIHSMSSDTSVIKYTRPDAGKGGK